MQEVELYKTLEEPFDITGDVAMLNRSLFRFRIKILLGERRCVYAGG